MKSCKRYINHTYNVEILTVFTISECHYVNTNKQKEFQVKKMHLLTQPTRIQDINFEDLDDGADTRGAERAERSRIRSYRKMRHQEA